MCASLHVCACVCIWRKDIKRSRVFSWAKAIMNNAYLLYCNFQNSHNNNSGKIAIIYFPQRFKCNPDANTTWSLVWWLPQNWKNSWVRVLSPRATWEVRGGKRKQDISRNSLPHADVSQQPGWNVSGLAFGSPTHAPPAPSAPCLPQTDSAITRAPG